MTSLIVGCGYLGIRVARRLRSLGDRVFGTTRSPSRAAMLAEEGIEPILVDVLDRPSLALLPAADRAFYAVGFDRSADVSRDAVAVDGLGRVLDHLSGRTGRIVYAGSTGVYGDHRGDWVDETTPTAPLTASGRAGLAAEEVLRAFAGGATFPVTVLRFAGLYGPGRLIRREALAAGTPIAADPEAYLNLIQIDDAAEAAVLALTAPAPGPLYLIGDDRPPTRGEFYRRLAEAIGAPDPTFTAPAGDGPVRGDASKRVSNRRAKDELGLTLTYPDISAGIPAALAAEREAGPLGGRDRA